MMQSISERMTQMSQTGIVEWIGISTGARTDIQPVDAVVAEVGTGLDADYHSKRRPDGIRQVTLIQHEHLPVIAALAGTTQVAPEQLRRNIVVSGINLLALKKQRFQIGDAVLEGTGPCDPCSRMDETIGPGGWQAMRGHGGLTARVLEPGMIRRGDTVRLLPDESHNVDSPTDDAPADGTGGLT